MDFEKNGTMHNLNFLTEVEVWSRVLTSLFKQLKNGRVKMLRVKVVSFERALDVVKVMVCVIH